MSLTENEILALISLLDDSDEFVFNTAKTRLLELGNEVVPILEAYWEQAYLEPTAQTNLVDIIHQIQFNHLSFHLEKWKQSGAKDLAEGCLLISKYQYPDLSEVSFNNELNLLVKQIWLELNPNFTALEQVQIFNYFFFNRFGFTGNKKHYHSPQNNFINQVLETRKGNPLSLSIIYLLLAQRVGLSVYGVNLPSHFVIAYVDENSSKPINLDDILFYINPFSKGMLLQQSDLTNFVNQLDLPNSKSFLLPCNNLDMVIRLLNNLFFIYKQQGLSEKCAEIEILRKILMP